MRRHRLAVVVLATVGLIMASVVAVRELGDSTEKVSPAVSVSTPQPVEPSSTGAQSKPLREIGELVIETAGSVLQDVRVTGRLTIRADNVTLRNVWVETGDYWVVMNYGRNTRIEHSTLIGTTNSQAALADFEQGNFIGDHLDIRGAADGVRMGSGSQLVSSVIHQLGRNEDTHNDAVEVSGARDVVLRDNVILNPGSQTSCIMLSDFSGSSRARVLIEGNLIAGGGYTIYGGAPITGVTVRGNRFSARFFEKSGYWGWVTYWAGSGNVWQDNVWDDGAHAGSSVDLPG